MNFTKADAATANQPEILHKQTNKKKLYTG